MIKVLIIILGLVLVLEGFILFILNHGLHTQIDKQSRVMTYQIPKPENLPGKIILSYDKKTWLIETAKILVPRILYLETQYSSLSHYFHASSGTSHPWAIYDAKNIFQAQIFNQETLGKILLGIAKEIKTENRDAEMILENNRVMRFIPEEHGRKLDIRKTRDILQGAILSNQENIDLVVSTTTPKVQLKNLNNMGIKQLLVTGESDFNGSSSARIKNITVGATKYNGLLIQPGEEFSFNKNLGQVDAKHGFVPELVIKPEGLTKEYGGGICQVATTAFRSAFFYGLPITARRNHSQAVAYYKWINEDMPRSLGLDATVYLGGQDLKFINNTPAVIMIWTRIEGKKLYFDFYGTPDERKITVDGPYEYDKRASGAIKARVKRIVTNNKTTLEEKEFISNYLPPKQLQAVIEYPKPSTEPEITLDQTAPLPSF